MLRVEDMWVQFFVQQQLELWEREGWHEKFGLPTRDNGFGHTPEQVTNFPALDLATLLQYGDAVRSGTREYLRGLSPQDFDVVPRGRCSRCGRHVPANNWGVLPAPGANRLLEGPHSGFGGFTAQLLGTRIKSPSPNHQDFRVPVVGLPPL